MRLLSSLGCRGHRRLGTWMRRLSRHLAVRLLRAAGWRAKMRDRWLLLRRTVMRPDHPPARTRSGPGRLGASAALLVSGCVPYVTPPLTLSVGGGPARNVPPKKTASSRPPNPSAAADVRLGVAPLGMVRELSHRSLDPSIGVIVQDGSTSFVGAFANLDGFVWQSSDEPNRWRLKTFGAVDYARGSASDIMSVGATMGVGVEYASFAGLTPFVAPADEEDGSGGAVGFAYGEWSVGMTLGMSHRSLKGPDLWMGFAALTFRLPASAGLLFLDFDSDDD